jgi:hypothetical protein
MRGLSPEHLVRLWEDGVGQHATDRALAILRAADTDTDGTALGDLPLGERDQRLLDLRARTFGGEMDAVASCPRCGSTVELHFSIADVSRPPDERPPESSVQVSGHPLKVRPLTSRDLAWAARCATPDEARRALATRCLEPAGAAIAGDSISEPELAVIAHALELVDPGAVRTLDLTCPDCREQWEGELDIAEFLWTEIEASAIRLLRDVHAIARAYGWPEHDILAMTPLRRRAYVELVQ